MESIVSLERGVCSCAELQACSCYRGWKEACPATRAISTTSRRVLSSIFFPLQDKVPKEIHAILRETLGEYAPSYAIVKNWVAQLKIGDFFSACDAPHPGQPKTETTPKIIDQIHKLILEDRRISAKSIAAQLRISCEWVGSIIHEELDMQKLSAKYVPKCLNADQKRPLCQLSEQHLEYFSAQSKWLLVAVCDHGRNMVVSL